MKRLSRSRRRKVPLSAIGVGLLLLGAILLARWAYPCLASKLWASMDTPSPFLTPTRSPTATPVDWLTSWYSTTPSSQEEGSQSGAEESGQPTLTPTLPPASTPIPSATPGAERPTEVPHAPPATRLVIPALGIDAPIVEVPITNKTWDVSQVVMEIAHLGGTANPGEEGNMMLAGHVTLLRGGYGPFKDLHKLEPGDSVIVYAGETIYSYQVVEKKAVAPTDVSVAYPTPDPTLTLITCINWDAQARIYQERLVVVAKLAEQASLNP